jgi:hypothetical protein
MKKFHKLAALCAALALTCSFTTVAYAASVTNEPAGSTSSSSSSVASGSSTASTDSSSTSGTSSASTVFTPAGTGTVVNTATDEDGKEFYTITTPDKNVFYLVIDRQRNGDNVYFLNAVTEKDLLALAEKSGNSSGTTASEGTTSADTSSGSAQTPASGTASQAGTETSAKSSSAPQSNSMGTLLLVLAVVLIGGGAGYYFKIYRPKHQRADSEDELDYSDENGSDIAEDSEQSDELPPSEDEGDESDGDGEV